jgi:hypothetical protein
VSHFLNFFSSKHNKDDNKIEWLKQELSGDKDQTESFTCDFTADDVDNVTLRTPQKSKHMSLDKETESVETKMRQCQGNSLFLSPTTQKLHNSVEKASNDTQPLYTTKSLREGRKNIIASVDHILEHDLV